MKQNRFARWSLAGNVVVTGAGAGQPTMIPLGNIPMIAGQPYGIYVILVSSNIDYTTGSMNFSNSDMTIITGAGTCGTFASVNPGRIFNGTVYYTTNACPNPVRTSITVTVLPLPVVALGNDTAACASLVLDAGNPSMTWLWSTTETTQQVTVTSSGQYSVIVEDGTCVGHDTINVAVNPNPVLTTSVADGNICLGESDTMFVSGAMLYNWSTGGIGTLEIVTPATTTAYTVYGLDANGCTDTDTLTIIVNNPTATLSLQLDTACTTGGSITLGGESPAGGTWSGTAVTGNSFDPVAAGVGMHAITYTYTDPNGCTATAVDSIWVDLCSGIDEAQNAIIGLFPNPTNGEFTLQLGGSGNMDVIMIDAIGRVIVSEQKTSGTHRFSLPASGVYLIVVSDENGNRSTRTVIVE